MLQLNTGQRINKRDWLLIIGLIFAPMTGLRIRKVGPAEALCLLWVLPYIQKRKIKANSILKFFVVFLGAMFLGSLWCTIISPKELTASQLLSWVYLAIVSLGLYEGLSQNTYDYNSKLFDCFARGAAVWYLFLYLFSIFVSRIFLGAPLWYAGYRFTGGATNPHQVAVLMCGLAFCFSRNVFQNKNPLANSLFAIFCIFIELQTAASTGVAALVVSFVVTIFIITGHIVKSKERRYIFYFVESLVIIILLIIYYRYLYTAIYGWILSDRNGLGRINLFRQIGNTFKKSPIFGLGTGMHAYDLSGKAKEYHNSYLEIIAMTGLVGTFAFLKLTIQVIRNMLDDDLLLPILIAIYTYGLGGFAMRRLAYWGIFVFVFVLAEQMHQNIAEEQPHEITL